MIYVYGVRKAFRCVRVIVCSINFPENWASSFPLFVPASANLVAAALSDANALFINTLTTMQFSVSPVSHSFRDSDTHHRAILKQMVSTRHFLPLEFFSPRSSTRNCLVLSSYRFWIHTLCIDFAQVLPHTRRIITLWIYSAAVLSVKSPQRKRNQVWDVRRRLILNGKARRGYSILLWSNKPTPFG